MSNIGARLTCLELGLTTSLQKVRRSFRLAVKSLAVPKKDLPKGCKTRMFGPKGIPPCLTWNLNNLEPYSTTHLGGRTRSIK